VRQTNLKDKHFQAQNIYIYKRIILEEQGLFILETSAEYLLKISIEKKVNEDWQHSELLAFGLCPSSGILKNTTFRKLDVFASSGELWETPALFGPLERARSSDSGVPHRSSEDRTRSSFRNVVFFRIPDDGQVQKPSNSEC
jgi:hypothetical protein